MRQNPRTIIVAHGIRAASGELFLDEDVTLDPENTKVVKFQLSDSVLSTFVGSDCGGQVTPLEMVEIAGWHGKPVQRVSVGPDKAPEHYEGAGFHREEGDNKSTVDGLCGSRKPGL
ncbi:hypothetical protein PMIN06_005388 [Paraphaeosphaeria minitans]